MVQCHGSFATATCTKCKRKVEAEAIREDIFAQRIPFCPICRDRVEAYRRLKAETPTATTQHEATTSTVTAATEAGAPVVSSQSGQLLQQPRDDVDTCRGEKEEQTAVADQLLQPGIMKPDIVFFGEGLGDEFHNSVARDKERADLLIMVGSSLKVRPVALIPSSVPKDIPQVLINREPLPHIAADVELLGDCDIIVDQLCRMLGWERLGSGELEETRELLEKEEDKTVREWQERKRAEEQRKQEQRNADQSDQETVSESLAGNVNFEAQQLDPTPFWQHRERQSRASRLPDSTYFFQPPSRYVFPGAEVYSEEEHSEEDSSSSSSTTDDETTNVEDVGDGEHVGVAGGGRGSSEEINLENGGAGDQQKKNQNELAFGPDDEQGSSDMKQQTT